MLNKIKHEIKEIASVTLYFAVCFVYIMVVKKLLLAEYQIQFYGISGALMGALISAKVLILMDKTTWGDRFQGQPLIRHVLYRSSVYGAMVLCVMTAEKLYHLRHEVSGLSEAVTKLLHASNLPHLLANFLCVWLSFICYSAWTEIDNHLGQGALRRLFFSREPAPDPKAESALPNEEGASI